MVRHCKHHGEIKRYSKSGKCVLCVKEYNRRYDEANREGKNRRKRQWCRENPELVREQQERFLAKHPRHYVTRRYGITSEQYEKLLQQQGGVCAVCVESCTTGKALGVDHDHRTGTVRGLLCVRCNRGIGIFLEDTTRLLRAIEYLEREGVVV